MEQRVFPNYYPAFSCTAGACRHSCCVGWEIDIDPDTLARYESVSGSLGKELKSCISREGEPHFITDASERCPFLNAQGLCRLILELGESSLCHICTEHPRFYNLYGNRTEQGLGLCCEAAGRLILGQREPMKLIVQGDGEDPADEFLALRDRVLAILQDRTHTLEKRLRDMLLLCGAEKFRFDARLWAERLLELERLEEAWTPLLQKLYQGADRIDCVDFCSYLGERVTEYEQLAVYLVYRHLANAADEVDLAARAAFAALGCEVLLALGALLWRETGSFSFDDQIELARLFSAEIEYSEENTDAVLDALAADLFTNEEENEMEIKISTGVQQDAIDVRLTVFTDEQGFSDGPDEIDERATQFVAYDGATPIGTCRLFTVNDAETGYVGRFAVLKEWRKCGVGRALMEAVEVTARAAGMKRLLLHAQDRAEPFYAKVGFVSFGDYEDEENYPHIWMKKEL